MASKQQSNMSTEQVAEEMDQLHKALIDKGVYRSCINCDHREGDTNWCNLFSAAPPINILVFGCNSWNYMPF
jgi:hypothetical protein